ncbi:agamous-like MADS-box protein AGL80 [Sorghum bicolor]|uniref:MADS-box domain-containing protein n=1 Tax=Sorghum bicolor TaxID=4558 RepID=A0A1B6PT90_SORBI|nr:agamous-like MADS-box protein AGL80 [Sorghum bicolor]KXG28889.1 hypothetical protein SORBI_3005G179900 [Sorghum bicolor]|eukprot:XP_021317822.1 agamous-like MADS-box protein AGL80 [Sorghum bicolor]
MARKKVNLQWISNNATRRATYKRRSQGLEKKASELTTLCGIKLCVVVYGEGEAQPKVWPSDEEAKDLLMKFNNMLDVSSLKKTKNQEDFLHSRSLKLHEQVSKLELENRERETLDLLHDSMYGERPSLIGTDKDELLSLRDMVEMKMRKIKARLQQLVVGQGVLPQPLPQVMLPVSSSLQTQASSYTYNEEQRMSVLEEHRPWQQDSRLANLAPNYSCPKAGSSSEPSSSGCEMMHPYNLGTLSRPPSAR